MRCNLGQLADITGMGVNTIKARVEDGMPCISRPEGRNDQWAFETVDVIAWLTGQMDAAAKANDAKNLKLRQQAAETGLKELDLAERQGRLIDIEDIMPHIEAGDAIVKSRFHAIPGRLAQALAAETDPAQVQRMLGAEIEGALEQLNKDWKDRG